MYRQITLMALLTVTVACGGGGSQAPAAAGAPTPTSRERNVITRAEIEQADWATNAFDLVQRLRPGFLRVSGPTNWSGASQTAIVRLNDQELGDFGALRQILVSSIQEIRYYSASEATAKFGGIRGRPVIWVTTK